MYLHARDSPYQVKQPNHTAQSSHQSEHGRREEIQNSKFLLAPGMLVVVIIVISACNELDCSCVLVVDSRVFNRQSRRLASCWNFYRQPYWTGLRDPPAKTNALACSRSSAGPKCIAPAFRSRIRAMV